MIETTAVQGHWNHMNMNTTNVVAVYCGRPCRRWQTVLWQQRLLHQRMQNVGRDENNNDNKFAYTHMVDVTIESEAWGMGHCTSS